MTCVSLREINTFSTLPQPFLESSRVKPHRRHSHSGSCCHSCCLTLLKMNPIDTEWENEGGKYGRAVTTPVVIIIASFSLVFLFSLLWFSSKLTPEQCRIYADKYLGKLLIMMLSCFVIVGSIGILVTTF